MCLGIPVQVVEVFDNYALCNGRNGMQHIDTMLLGKVEVGQWLLTFLDAGRELIEEQRARLINAALDGLQAAEEGGEIDWQQFFPDLVGREPELPEFLRGSGA